jgi:hypothetical protein
MHFDHSRLNISGSKTMSISVSNQTNLGINQSLFLRIDGELGENVYIKAQISDSQSPITSQGTTAELSALDEVYFSVYGRQYEVSFGDLIMNITGTQFINYNPRFSGFKLSYFDKNKVAGAIAITNSQSGYSSFVGIEGIQGPYFLRPTGVNTNVAIVSGTETIWLNGVELKRGSDYRIDYNEGCIEFFVKHFISANSRVTATFQYTDDYYRKDAGFVQSEVHLTDRLSFGTAMIYQSDDKDNPLLFNYSADDIELLKNAGNNRVFVSGENFVGSGVGRYKKVEGVYIYALGETDADYDVFFTNVGVGNGDYERITLYRFDFVGVGEGSWLPIREVVAPVRRANYDVNMRYSTDHIEIYVESLFSENNLNTFSRLENENNFSQIHHIQTRFRPDWDLLQPQLDFWYRYRQKNLYTFAFLKNPDDRYSHHSFPIADSLNSNELFANLQTVSFEFFEQKTSFRRIDFENRIVQNYLNLYQATPQTKYLPEFKYSYFWAENSDDHINHKNRISISEPSARYKYRQMTVIGNGSFQHNRLTANEIVSGTRQQSFLTGVAIDEIKNNGISLTYQNEKDFEREENIWSDVRDSETYTIETYTRFRKNNITTLFSHRIVQTYSPERSEQKFDIAEIRTQNSLFSDGFNLNSTYNLKNTEFFPRLRELIYVGEGIGYYDSTGVAVERGDYDWETGIVGEPVRSVEVNANFSIYTYPDRFFSGDSDFLSRINLETHLSIAEQTSNSDRWGVYLLNPNALMNDKSFYSQQKLQQTVWYNIERNKYISRYVYQNDKIWDNRFNEGMRHSLTENEFTLRILRVRNNDFENKFKLKTEKDSRYELTNDARLYEIDIRTTTTPHVIFNTKISYETENITTRGESQKNNRYAMSEEILIWMGFKYRFDAKMSVKYNSVKNPVSVYLPHHLVAGTSLNWQTGFDIRMNQISTLNFNYSGYKYPTIDTFHQVKMEVRAEF